MGGKGHLHFLILCRTRAFWTRDHIYNVMSFLLEECGVSNWIPDREAPKCHRCRTAFTFFHRRHHCRYCGGVFCGRCSFVMNKRYPPAHRKIRICVYCHTLYFRHKDMVQEGEMPSWIVVELNVTCLCFTVQVLRSSSIRKMAKGNAADISG